MTISATTCCPGTIPLFVLCLHSHGQGIERCRCAEITGGPLSAEPTCWHVFLIRRELDFVPVTELIRHTLGQAVAFCGEPEGQIRRFPSEVRGQGVIVRLFPPGQIVDQSV